MKLIEALKNLKTIEKRQAKNREDISKYASYVHPEALAYETEEKQAAEVQSLVQANIDLEGEYIRLKRAIEYTNANTKVTIGTRENTIAELITIRRITGKWRIDTYNALNNFQAVQKIQTQYRTGVDATNPPKVVSLFKEEEKNKKLREWDEFVSAIDGKLEVVNAETELQGY